MTRLGLDEARAAAYLGVPVFTFRKWATGTRKPAASAVRLLEVLGMIEALAPALHAGLVPGKPDAHVDKVPGKSNAHVGKVRAKSKSTLEKS